MTNAQPQHVAEVVTFKLNPGISDDAFLDAMHASHAYISGIEGFLSRQLSKDKDGTWVDYTIWASMENAMTAAGGFMAQEFAPAILEAIDKESFSMRHQPVLWAPLKAA